MRNALRVHGLPPDVPVAHGIDDLFQDLLVAWREQRWFLASSVCGLVGELLFGSLEGGGTLGPLASGHGRRFLVRETLRALRNACFHPAHVHPDGHSGIPHYQRLAEQLGRVGSPAVAKRLRDGPKALRSRELA